ncbi:hypothetical protein DN752_01370 [Echinicola strongylocentroti]|uniref:RHS repeat-associated core domain-containing protein n=1 Tax=Echinicola strongylocentroti TaxID=1795355 RepID=A0A2Z4IE04_9BACT|nr:hypothetical protein DN752_01370 [Echinicola strongylocentroti]
MEQKYLFNRGRELIDDLNLGLYWTPNRFYDPSIGRFSGLDKLSDMYTSISPMVFGFNNPIKFNDPTGLLGECDDCPEVDLPEVTVTASRLQESTPDYSLLFEQFRNSTNTVYRNLGYVAQNRGAKEARDLLSRGRTLHYSDYEAQQSKNSEYLDGIRNMYKYGVTGSILAIAASPILLETLANKAGGDMALEAGFQIMNSLLYNGDLSQVDIADIGFAAFSKYGFVGMAILDYTPGEGVVTVGTGKNAAQFGTDLLIGGFNKWHTDKMGVAGVEKGVVEFFNGFNGNLRNTVGTGVKKGFTDE